MSVVFCLFQLICLQLSIERSKSAKKLQNKKLAANKLKSVLLSKFDQRLLYLTQDP